MANKQMIVVKYYHDSTLYNVYVNCYLGYTCN